MLNKTKILDAIEKDIMEAEEFYIPVKKVWYWLKEEYREYPSLKELTVWLKKDNRFVIHNIQTEREDDSELEDMGYFSGPRVGLKRRKPTKEDMARILCKHAGNVTKFLEKAYNVKPQDLDEDEAKTLDEAMKKARSLEKKIKKLFKGRRK